jgi:predicted dehydrogenase
MKTSTPKANKAQASEKQNHKRLVAPVRCAIVGLGMGRYHARCLHEDPQASVVAVADIDAAKLDSYATDNPKAARFTDHREMLKQVQPDLVIVALPNALHKPVTLDALAAGAHVLCEKPMAMTVAEAEAMRDAAKAAGRRLGINFSQRFAPGNRALKALVGSGALGEVYHGYCSWTRRDGFPGFGGWFGQKKLSGGGPLIDLGVHRIDMCLWLMGHPEVASVSGAAHHRIGIPRAQAQGKAFDVEDFASGFVRFANGASLVFEVSWAGHQKEKETQVMRILGTEGSIDMDRGTFHHFRRDGAYCTTQLDTEGVKARNSVSEMVNSLITGEPFWGTPEHGIAVQKILNGLYESAQTGREVVYR